LALCVAVLAALVFSQRFASYRHVARGLALLLVIDMSRLVTARRPDRVGFDVALVLSWYIVQTWTVWVSVVPRRRALSTASAWAVWAVGVGLLTSAWPHGGRGLELAWTAVYGLAVVAQVVALLSSSPVRLGPEAWMSHPSPGVGIWLALSSCADVVGPWIAAQPVRDWYSGKGPAITTWTVIAGWEVCSCWMVGRRRRGSCSPRARCSRCSSGGCSCAFYGPLVSSLRSSKNSARS